VIRLPNRRSTATAAYINLTWFTEKVFVNTHDRNGRASPTTPTRARYSTLPMRLTASAMTLASASQ
jgi:hypothetical protein